jgi:hypothetical protein
MVIMGDIHGDDVMGLTMIIEIWIPLMVFSKYCNASCNASCNAL